MADAIIRITIAVHVHDLIAFKLLNVISASFQCTLLLLLLLLPCSPSKMSMPSRPDPWLIDAAGVFLSL